MTWEKPKSSKKCAILWLNNSKKWMNNMQIRSLIIGFIVGAFVGVIPGFGLGIYVLPILIAEDGANTAQVADARTQNLAKAVFQRDLKGSDGFHWGDGTLFLSREQGQYFFTLDGEISPGPDYKLYLTQELVDDEASFKAIKDASVYVADIKAYENFRIAVPAGIDPGDHKAVVIWCERFEEFITAGQLQNQ
jgi:hypothetical protein